MDLIEPGTRAPNFRLADQHGERHTLAKYRGRAVVLYFYPKDDTAHCTVQACQFRDHHPDFSKLEIAVLGISPDGVETHERFAGAHDLTFPLLADEKRDQEERPVVCSTYGVWQEKTLYGRQYLGVVRTTYLIDEKGVVRRRWDRVRVRGHAMDVLGAARELKGVEGEPKRAPKKRASERKARAVTRTGGGTRKKVRAHPR